MELIDSMKKIYFLHLEHEVVMDLKYEEDGHFLKVTVKTINGTTNSAWHFNTTYEYVVCPTGEVLIRVSGVPGGKRDDRRTVNLANGSSSNLVMGN